MQVSVKNLFMRNNDGTVTDYLFEKRNPNNFTKPNMYNPLTIQPTRKPSTAAGIGKRI